MAQETGSKATALVSALDNTGDVGHNERLMVAHLNDTQIRFECGKGVVGNLRLCGRDNRQERTLTSIGEAHKTYIGQHLKLQDEGTLIAILTGLCIARSLIRSTLEVPVTQTTTTTLEKGELLAVLGNLTDVLDSGRTILLLNHSACNGTQRYGDNNVGSILTRRACAVTTLAILSKLVALVFEVNQSPILAVALQNNATALTAIAAIGSAKCNELLTTKVARACASVARTGKNLHIVHKV